MRNRSVIPTSADTQLTSILCLSAGGGGRLLVPGLPRAGVRVHRGGGGRVLPALRRGPLPG